MRTYEDIYREYLNWLRKKTGNSEYDYNVFFSSRNKNTARSILYKSILELCYDTENGMYYFCKFIIGNLSEIGYPTPFRFNLLLRKWDKLLKNNRYLSILCARGHGKTVFFSELSTIYYMFLFQYRRVIIESASQEQAERILDEIKTIVDNNEWLLSKKNPDMWRAGKLGYNKGYVLGKGFGSEILGEHVDRIVIDDILRSDNKLTDTQIEDFIDMTLEPMLLNRKGQMIIVGTPRTETDIFTVIEGRIKKDKRCPWKIAKFPAILDYETKELQCPDRFTWKDIINKRLVMGALKFGREYQLEFFSRDASLFPERLVKPALEKGKDMGLINVADKRDPNWSFIAAVDVARSGSVSADFTVMFVLAYNSVSQAKQIAHMWRSKGLKISEQSYYIAEIAKKFNNCPVLVEQNNIGQDMIDVLIDDYNVYVESFLTGGKGQKKEELIRFLIQAFEHEQIIMPCGDEYSEEQMRILEDELSKFCVVKTPAGNERFQGIGSHDDTVIALALANKATQMLGMPFAVSTFGESNKNVPSMYNSFIRESSNESDLVQKIRMGLIK